MSPHVRFGPGIDGFHGEPGMLLDADLICPKCQSASHRDLLAGWRQCVACGFQFPDAEKYVERQLGQEVTLAVRKHMEETLHDNDNY